MPRALGSVATSATTDVPIYDKTYTEQTANGQRSLKSASANDAAAGTGVRQVRVTYYSIDGSGVVTGPFTELVTLNGVTAVPFVSTTCCFVEKVEAVLVGSGGVAAGDITLYANNDGTGAAIAILASGGVQTFLGHHYIASGARCRLTDIAAQGGDAAAAVVSVKRQTLPAANQAEVVIGGQWGASASVTPSVPIGDRGGLLIAGPARVRLTVKPANGNAQTTRASLGFVDESNPFAGLTV